MSPKRNRFNDRLSPFGQGNERQRSICARFPVVFLNLFRHQMSWNEGLFPSPERAPEGPGVPMGDTGCCHHRELVLETWICTWDPRELRVKYSPPSILKTRFFDLHPSALIFLRLRIDDKKHLKGSLAGKESGVNQRARCTSYNLLWLI